MSAQSSDIDVVLAPARRYLKRGNVSEARSNLYGLSQNPYVIEFSEYWRVRAIAEFLCGRDDEARNCLIEAKTTANDQAFFDEYILAVRSLARRSKPFFKRRQLRHERLLTHNIDFACQLTSMIGMDDEALRKELRAIVPRERRMMLF